MKTQFTLIFLFFVINLSAQDAKYYYKKGIDEAQAGKLEEAINLFSKAIELTPEDYYSWFNRGIAKSMLRRYEESLLDFEQTVKLAPDYKKGWLNKGISKKQLTDYEGAIADYTHAIQIEPNYADAYYNRGLIYELLSKPDSACADFTKAKTFGIEQAQKKIDKCNGTEKSVVAINPILRLTKRAENDKYGFSETEPVKVGTGPDGGPSNQRRFLELLRDGQGKPITYQRMGGCCPYKSKNGFGGMAMVDRYEITYHNEKGEVKKSMVYLSFYDYEEPQILFGFNTVGNK